MTQDDARPSRAFLALLIPAFFLSGSVALVYQALWTRQLGLVFGVTIQAASTVLACFMGGLALGSAVAGRWSDRLARPLRAFALVEVGIAASALLTPVSLELADALLMRLAPTLQGSPVGTTAARVGLTAVVLLVPATLMGMTYPLVLKSVSRGGDGIRRMASLLYAVNTTGAIAGVLAGSLWLVPHLGIRRTFLVAAAVNGLVALVAFLASRHERPRAGAAPATSTPTSPLDVSPAARTAVLVVLAVSGAVSLALEIVWFRILVFFLRPTTYAFACMLAAVLSGLAIGSYVITPFMRRRMNWLAVLGFTEIAIGLTGLLSAFLLVRSNAVMVWVFTLADPLSPPWDFVLPLFIAAAFAILPTTVLLGAAFPLGLVLWTSDGAAEGQRAGQRVGTLYAANVAGAIAGSLLGGFVLIPALGAQRSLVLITALPLLGGLALIWLAPVRAKPAVIAAAVVTFAAIAWALPDVFSDVIARRYPDHHVIWHAEDAQSTVSVVRHDRQRMLLIDGMHHASDGHGQVSFHRALGSLAVAVHPDPKRILVVGLGGGVTAGGAAILPGTRTTVVELSPSVLEAARFFYTLNRRILTNPSVSLVVADGRQFLKTTQDRFDVMTADLMLPHLAGAASLYSADYYALARRALAPGGIMVQWIPVDAEFQHKLMLRSFVSAFPHVTLWSGGSIAIGSDRPITFSEAQFGAKLAKPDVAQAFDEAGLGDAGSVLGQYFAGQASIARYLGEGPMLRDDRPITEYFLSLPADSPRADLRPFADPPASVVGREAR